MSKDDLLNLDVEEEKAEIIMQASQDVEEYLAVKSLQDLGFTIHHSEFSFDKIMLFSWIREELKNG